VEREEKNQKSGGAAQDSGNCSRNGSLPATTQMEMMMMEMMTMGMIVMMMTIRPRVHAAALCP
jgi:hypothetical protein